MEYKFYFIIITLFNNVIYANYIDANWMRFISNDTLINDIN